MLKPTLGTHLVFAGASAVYDPCCIRQHSHVVPDHPAVKFASWSISEMLKNYVWDRGVKKIRVASQSAPCSLRGRTCFTVAFRDHPERAVSPLTDLATTRIAKKVIYLTI